MMQLPHKPLEALGRLEELLLGILGCATCLPLHLLFRYLVVPGLWVSSAVVLTGPKFHSRPGNQLNPATLPLELLRSLFGLNSLPLAISPAKKEIAERCENSLCSRVPGN